MLVGIMERPPNQRVSLLDRSFNAAKSLTIPWMRDALREVALQAIRQSLKITEALPVSDKTPTDAQTLPCISLTEKDVLLVKYTCRKVATAWENKLREAHHDEAADWLKELVKSELDTLFEPTITPLDTDDKGDKNSTLQLVEPSQANLSSESCKKSFTVKLLEVQQAIHVPSILDNRKSGNQSSDSFGSDVVDDTQTQLARAIERLDELGRRKETDWPYDWASTIEPAAAQIQARLYPSKIGRKASAGMVEQVSLVPRTDTAPAEIAHTRKDQTGNVVVEHTSANEWLVHRKRKSSHRRYDSKKQREILPPPKQRSTTPVVPRSPTDISEERFTLDDVHRIVPPDEIEKHLISSVEESGSNRDEKAHVLGSLCDIGWNHAWIQRHPERDESLPLHMSVRSQRRSAKDRLGDHMKEAASDHGMVSFQTTSKVFQTQDRYPETEASKQHWLELDLAGCPILFDVAVPSESSVTKRRIIAFRSIEVIALDEDEE